MLLKEPFKVDKVLRNRARCKKCGDTIESRSTHHMAACGCGRIAVDGGLSYLKRVGKLEFIEELSETREVWIQFDSEKGREVEVEKPV